MFSYSSLIYLQNLICDLCNVHTISAQLQCATYKRHGNEKPTVHTDTLCLQTCFLLLQLTNLATNEIGCIQSITVVQQLSHIAQTEH